MKKKNVQTIKHVIGVLTAEGGGNEIIDHCVRELAALFEKDGLREYVRLLARETARELRPKLEAVKECDGHRFVQGRPESGKKNRR